MIIGRAHTCTEKQFSSGIYWDGLKIIIFINYKFKVTHNIHLMYRYISGVAGEGAMGG